MSAERIYLFDGRTHLIKVVHYLHFFVAVEDSASERVFRHITDCENDIAFVADIVCQVMEHAPCFAHTVRADDDHGAVFFVERFGFVDARRKVERAEAEGIFVMF